MASSPKRFAGAVLFEVNRPLTVVTDLCCPRLSKGQVLVRMQYAGVCHSQLMEAKGKRGNDRYLPHMLGHEGVGEVLEIGPGVKKVTEGDHVVVGWMKDKGLEGGPKVYSSNSFGDINAGSCTTFSEFSVVSENRIYKKPKNTATDQCVLYGCALPTGAGLVFNELKPKPNSNIGVLGLGGVDWQ